MAVDAKTRGLQALADLYPDPTLRQARQEELGEAGVELLGKHVLRQDDYSRSMNELSGQRTAAQTAEADAKALYESNKTWFEQHQADLQELDRLRTQVAGTGKPDPAKPAEVPAGMVTREVFDKTLAETERGAVAFITDLNSLSLQHFHQFGEVLDTQALLLDKRVQQIGLRGVYAELHKDQLTAREAKLKQEAEDKIRADERQKVLAGQAANHHPYPVRGNEPSTLDALETARAGTPPATKSIDDMAAEYARLSAARTGLPA